MYVLEIETNNKLKKIENPIKARIVNNVFFDKLQIMTGDGKWHTICFCSVGVSAGQIIVFRINKAIKNKKAHIFVDI